MRLIPTALGLGCSLLPLAGQDSPEPAAPKANTGYVSLTFHQITPGEDLRDANSRSGYGAALGFEGESGRLVLEGAFFPVQSRLIDGLPRRVDVIAFGIGADFKQTLARQDQAALYAFVGGRIDYWSTGTRGGESPDNSAGNLGLRLGLGARLGPLVGEVRYRFTFGDVRVDSDTHGPAMGWSAYELAVGFAF